jgi:hypothetical protein
MAPVGKFICYVCGRECQSQKDTETGELEESKRSGEGQAFSRVLHENFGHYHHPWLGMEVHQLVLCSARKVRGQRMHRRRGAGYMSSSNERLKPISWAQITERSD